MRGCSAGLSGMSSQTLSSGSQETRPLRILIVSTSDVGGGAERSAWNVHKMLRQRGHASHMAVGRKLSSDPEIKPIPNDENRSAWSREWYAKAARLDSAKDGWRGMDRLRDFYRLIGQPRRWLDERRGHEDIDFPGTSNLLQLFGVPDVVHCFNLHGGYFDLRFLAPLSQRLPVIVDLRDAWLLTGHCAHSLDCARWQIGCGECPDLSVYPAIRSDGTAYNWQRKRKIFAASRLYVSTPCRWLKDRVEQSMLAPAIIEARVIATGVDLKRYHPGDQAEARAALGLPQGEKILLFAANGVRRNPWKDFETMRAAVSAIAERMPQVRITFLALGENSPPERFGRAQIRFVPYEQDPVTVTRYYQAADLYLHAAKADTFPRVIIEALACGTPVVATAVGGIVEQVKSLRGWEATASVYDASQATGILVRSADPAGLAAAADVLLRDESLRQRLGQNGARDARSRWSLEKQTDRYLDWYSQIVHRSVDPIQPERQRNT